jgi:20S proteasome subunit beta 3
MVGNKCAAISADTRLGVQYQTVAMNFQKVFKVQEIDFKFLASRSTYLRKIYP